MPLRLTCLVVLMLVSHAVAAAAAPTGGLSPADIAKLRKTGCPVVVPTYVPAGFRLQQVKVDLDRRFGTSYQIHYKGPGKSDFIVQMANGGIGDGPDGDPFPFVSPVFGKGTLCHIRAEGHVPDSVWSGWLPYPGRKFPVYSVSGGQMDPRVAVKVTESLRILDK